MYTTLQADSLKQIVVRSADDLNEANISTVTGKPKRTRSKKGCLCCRMRKKKCDEQRPSCGLCITRGIQCVYQELPSSKRKTVCKKIPEEDSVSSLTGVILPEASIAPVAENIDSLLQEKAPVKLEAGTGEFDEFLFLSPGSKDHHEPEFTNQEYSLLPYNKKHAPVDILVEPIDPYKLILDERGYQLVYFFQNEIIHRICISPKSCTNHFASTFTGVSYRDESVLRLLAAWGALFVDGPNSASLKSRMDEADLSLRRFYSNKVLDDQDKFNLICFHLNAAGIGVCSGDTKEWIYHHRKCGELIRGFGSTKNFLAKMSYLNSAKWVISNLHYNDVMSSESLKNGTLLTAEEYGSPFKDETDFSYGIDPLQGCMHLVFLVLCEILHSYSVLSSLRRSLNEDVKNFAHDPSMDLNVLNERRLQHCKETEKHAKILWAKVEACKPRKNQECFIEPSELANHHTLFEAFRNTCKLYVLMYIRELPPRTPEVQAILFDTFKLLDVLIECDLRAAVTKVMLLCGLACCKELDRIELRNKFTRLQTYYKVFNVHNVRHIVEQIWVANPDGHFTIDWGETCEKMDWTLAAF